MCLWGYIQPNINWLKNFVWLAFIITKLNSQNSIIFKIAYLFVDSKNKIISKFNSP